MKAVDVESFPSGNQFLEDVLNGKFEFPDSGEGGIYFLPGSKQGIDGSLESPFFEAASGIGLAREEKVADITGGTLARDPNNPQTDLKVTGGGTSIRLDVLGANGEYILVGGQAKANNLDKLQSDLSRFRRVADANGRKAQAYFVDNTPQSVIDIANEKLGGENVFLFPEAQID